MLTVQHGGYFFDWFGLWTPYSDYCMVCFFCKVILKSDTAVALRRSLSKVPCVIVVSIINFYFEYFCELMWLSAKSLQVLELLNITRQCQIWFLHINMHFIEQTHMYCVTWSPMSVIWWRSSKVSDSFDLYFCFLWLLSLAEKIAVFFCDLVVT